MIEAGQNCQRFLEAVIRRVQVEDVQADEIWGFVGMKEKTRVRLDCDEAHGDAYCFTAIERTSKLTSHGIWASAARPTRSNSPRS